MALTYDEIGSGRPVVFLHGWLSSRRVFGYQLYGLADTCQAIAVDLPGYGGSDLDLTRPWFPQAVDAVVDLCAGLPGPPLVVGWSIGSAVARAAVPRLPGAGLVVVAAGLSTPDESVLGRMRAQLLRDYPRYARTLTRTFSATASAETEEWLFRMALDIPVPSALASIPAAVDLPDLPVDAVVVHGDLDQQVRPANRLAPATGQPITFAASGHAPFLDEKDRFNEVVAGLASSS